MLGTLIVSIFAELAALHSVDLGRATHFSRVLTIVGLITLGIALVSSIFLRFFRSLFPTAKIHVALNLLAPINIAVITAAGVYTAHN